MYICYIIITKLQVPIPIVKHTTGTADSAEPTPTSPKPTPKVTALDPDVIAPFLKDPPKPSGGFGRQS